MHYTCMSYVFLVIYFFQITRCQDERSSNFFLFFFNGYSIICENLVTVQTFFFSKMNIQKRILFSHVVILYIYFKLIDVSYTFRGVRNVNDITNADWGGGWPKGLENSNLNSNVKIQKKPSPSTINMIILQTPRPIEKCFWIRASITKTIFFFWGGGPREIKIESMDITSFSIYIRFENLICLNIKF